MRRETGVLRVGRERAGQGPGGLVEAPRVEAGDAQRVLDLREVGVERGRLLEELGRAEKALALGLHHAQVEVRAGQVCRHPALEIEPLPWRERRERNHLGHGQDDRLSAGRQRLREPPLDLAVLRVPPREPREDVHGGGGLTHSQVRQGQGPERAVRFDRGRGRAAERLPGLRQPPLGRLQRSHQQPSFQEGGAVAAFGGLGLALAQAALGRRDRTHEGGSRVRAFPGEGPRRKEATRQEGRDENVCQSSRSFEHCSDLSPAHRRRGPSTRVTWSRPATGAPARRPGRAGLPAPRPRRARGTLEPPPTARGSSGARPGPAVRRTPGGRARRAFFQ